MHQQVRALRTRGHDVRVISQLGWAPPGLPRWAPHRSVPRATHVDGVPVLHPRMMMLPGARLGHRICHTTRRSIAGPIRRLAREWPFDLVHAHMLIPDGWAAASAGHAAGVPVVATAHGSADVLLTPYRSDGWRRTVVEAITEIDQIIAVSQAIADGVTTLAQPRHPIHVIPNGADPALFAGRDRDTDRAALGLPTDRPIALFVGHLTELKGVANLLDAFGVYAAHAQNSPRLVIVGHGPLEGALRARATELGLQESIRILGALPQKDVAAWMSACDVLVLPSRSEGLPTVICEAMVAGRAVIATAVGGTPELVENGVTGMLLAPNDTPAITRALSEVLDSPGRALAMGAAAHARAATSLTWDAVAAQIESVYDQVCARHRGHSVPGRAA